MSKYERLKEKLNRVMTAMEALDENQQEAVMLTAEGAAEMNRMLKRMNTRREAAMATV